MSKRYEVQGAGNERQATHFSGETANRQRFFNRQLPVLPLYISDPSAIHSTDFRFFHSSRHFRSDLREFRWFFPHWTAVCSEFGRAVGSGVWLSISDRCSPDRWKTKRERRHEGAVSVWSSEGPGFRV